MICPEESGLFPSDVTLTLNPLNVKQTQTHKYT